MIMLNHPGENLSMWSLRVMLKPGLTRAVLVKKEQFLGKTHLNASSFSEGSVFWGKTHLNASSFSDEGAVSRGNPPFCGNPIWVMVHTPQYWHYLVPFSFHYRTTTNSCTAVINMKLSEHCSIESSGAV